MSKLHTYKFNEAILQKSNYLVLNLNHGLVMCLDWSGSMSENLNATLTQLFNLIWFCRKTKIPFDVYVFQMYMQGIIKLMRLLKRGKCWLFTTFIGFQCCNFSLLK